MKTCCRLAALALLATSCSSGASTDTTPPTADTTPADVAAPDVAIVGDVASATTDAAEPVADAADVADATEAPDVIDTDTGELPEGHVRLTHSFGTQTLAAYEETQPCVTWTLHNEQPIYVQGVTLSNDGEFHHSNWFVVPEDTYPGPDGFFKCGERNFQEIGAALEGTVIFAQSTQSRSETQRLPDGVVVKVPPHHKIISSTHLLNLSSEPSTTELRMSLELIHPSKVTDITTPFRLTYFDLQMDPKSETRFSGTCDFADAYSSTLDKPLDMKLYWVLPHYHYLGNFFELSIVGGPKDGEILHEVDVFDGEAHGKAFDPPVDLHGAKGLHFTCGYVNPRDEKVGWGIGDQEMCVMLGLASSGAMMDGIVGSTDATTTEAGIIEKSGPCGVIAFPKNPTQTPPTADELAGPMYVPESNDADSLLDPVKACADTPVDAAATGEPTLTAIRDTIFKPACSYSACHGGPKAAAGLNFDVVDLHGALLGHTVMANTTLPLVAPGDPAGSYLLQLMSQCEPKDASGAVVAAMPRNAPFLMNEALVARVRDWILAGAKDD